MTIICEGVFVFHLVSERSCSLMRWIHSPSSGARYEARYSSRSFLKRVGDSPSLDGLPSGNRGNRGLSHNLAAKTQTKHYIFSRHKFWIRGYLIRFLIPCHFHYSINIFILSLIFIVIFYLYVYFICIS